MPHRSVGAWSRPPPHPPPPPCPLPLPCRRASLFVPWKCEHERHEYEKCEYKDYKRRVALAQQQQQQQQQAPGA